mmetsp:Transcript_2667/g.8049  ORF Transcript_2667/g.8049 Transcript_2667/m.8049 type:complete len:200 (-) Transcript_2667:85-684(-)
MRTFWVGSRMKRLGGVGKGVVERRRRKEEEEQGRVEADMSAFVSSWSGWVRGGGGRGVCGQRPAVPGAGTGTDAQRRAVVVMATKDGLRKVVLAGGSGFVGKYISRKLVDDGCDEVIVLSRGGKPSPVKTVLSRKWDPADSDGEWVKELRNADAVINLCGELIVQPWTEKTKKRLVESRLQSTSTLVEAMSNLPQVGRP